MAGIPARLLRVGFVGELGYEIHVPSSQGEALWDALMEAGQAHDIRPFGVEAQRVLRLEKGHIIIGQDTDAMTSPDEVDMAWAIAKKKPFFVGGRSIELRRRHPSKRKLVGFTIEDPRAPIPLESNLVLRGGEMVGFITSVARSPNAGQDHRLGLHRGRRGRAGRAPGDQADLGQDDHRPGLRAAFLRSRQQAPGDVAMVAPSEHRQRSFLARKLIAAGASFGQLGDGAVALDFGATDAERAAAESLGLTDLSPLPRCGFKGAGTSAWVSACGADLPGAPNQATRQPGGELIARLAPEEALILGALDSDGPGLVQTLSDAWSGEPGTGYPLPRQDSHCWLYVSGRHAAAMFLKICAVDLRPHKFADLSIAQTSVARASGIVIRDDRGGTLGYHLLADSASAAFIWDCLLDAMVEFDGRPVGLTALRGA